MALLVNNRLPALPSPPRGGGEEASRSSDGERTGNLDSQIPKESVSLCQDKEHLARFYSKACVTSNKLLPREVRNIKEPRERGKSGATQVSSRNPVFMA